MTYFHRTLTEWVSRYPYSIEALAVFRIVFGLYTLCGGIIPNLLYMASFPAAFYTPPLGIAMLFSGFPAEWAGWILLAVGYILCGCVILGVYTSVASFVFGCYLFVCYAFAFSLGKINHNTGYLILPCFLAFSRWGHAFSIDSYRQRVREIPAHRDSFVVALYALTLGWLYCTAALPKIIGGWLNPSTHAVYGWFVQTYHGELQRALLAPFFMHYTPLFLWESADWLTVAFELFFVLSVVNRRRLQVFCSCAVVFHWLVLNTLNIPSAGFLVCYCLFFPNLLARLSAQIQAVLVSAYRWRIAIGAVVALCVSAWWASLSYHALLHLPFAVFDNFAVFDDTASLSVYHHLRYELLLAFVVESCGLVLVVYGAVWWLYKRVVG